MYESQSIAALLSNVFFKCLTFRMCLWPSALKRGCIANFDMLFFVMVFISSDEETQFMLISSPYFCVRIIKYIDKRIWRGREERGSPDSVQLTYGAAPHVHSILKRVSFGFSWYLMPPHTANSFGK